MTPAAPVTWVRDADGVAVVTLDAPGRSVNTMDFAFVEAFGDVVAALAAAEGLTGVVLRSAKSTFFAGGDLAELYAAGPDDVAGLTAANRRIKAQLRALETLTVPVVAAIDGAALGGGLELALATHHRVAVDSPRTTIGFPEVTLGLLPGAGGVVRSVRMLGLDVALQRLLLDGRSYGATEAVELGLLDTLVPTGEDLLPAAKSWIATHAAVVQPWDQPGYSIPGGTPRDAALAATLRSLPARLRERLNGAAYPAPGHIMAAAVEGAQVDLASAMEIETRYFVNLVIGQVAKNMIRGRFLDRRRVAATWSARSGPDAFTPRSVMVLGAGLMGAGIAYEAARAGLHVYLKDVDEAAAARGQASVERIARRAVKTGSLEAEEADALVARVETCGEVSSAHVDFLIEAVPEDADLKAAVIREVVAGLGDVRLVASNTSTLPIAELAESTGLSHAFLGLHFFSPVDRMPIVEVIRGTNTSEDTFRSALDVVRLLGKIPIVVNDSRGFYTSRVISTMLNEALAMVGEGIPAPSIERAALAAGYPMPALQLCDELTLTLNRLIRRSGQQAVELAGGTWSPHSAESVVDRMLDDFDRPGRSARAGFYEYEDGRRTGLWSGLATAFPTAAEPPPFQDLVDRLLFVEAIESARCLEEGVLQTVAEANVASLLAIAFPAWTGGTLQFINGYPDGPAGFVTRAHALADTFGSRFAPPELLVSLAARGATLEDPLS